MDKVWIIILEAFTKIPEMRIAEFHKGFKDTLKAFDDLKRSKKVYEVMFFICKSMFILKVYSVHYTLR